MTLNPSHRLRALAAMAALVTAVTYAASAPAHQTSSDGKVAVTMHVTPDDEPIAGASSPITIVRVRVPKGAKFTFGSCACTLLVQNSAGAIIFNGRVGKRSSVVFPEASAYRITYAGRYRKGSRTRKFRTTFSVRAVAG